MFCVTRLWLRFVPSAGASFILKPVLGRSKKGRGLTLSSDEPELDIVHRLLWRMGIAALAGDPAFLKMERWAYANGGPRRTAINVIRYFVSLGWTPQQIVETTLDRLASLLPQEPLEPQIVRISRRQLLKSLGTSELEFAD